MPKGPLGGPRPLATGDVLLLITVEEIKHDSRPGIIETTMRNRGFDDITVEWDTQARTYSFNTGLDSIGWLEARELKEAAEEVLKFANMNVVGTQIAFR